MTISQPITPSSPTESTEFTAPTGSTSIISPIEPVTQKKSPLIAILLTLLMLTTTAATYFYSQSRPASKVITDNTSSPTPVATMDPTEDWQTYVNQDIGFSTKVPSTWEIKEDDRRTTIDDYLSISSFEVDPENCHGDCSSIVSAEIKVVNGINMRYISSWWGEIGGNTAQSFVRYAIPYQNNGYIIITLQELPFSTHEVGRQHQPIAEKRLIQFDQILQTFQFTN